MWEGGQLTSVRKEAAVLSLYFPIQYFLMPYAPHIYRNNPIRISTNFPSGLTCIDAGLSII